MASFLSQQFGDANDRGTRRITANSIMWSYTGLPIRFDNIHSKEKFVTWSHMQSLFRIPTRGAQTDVRPYNFFLVRHKSRTRFRLYGMIYGCTARTKDVRLRKNRSGNKFRKIEKVIDHTGPKFWKFKYLVGTRDIQYMVYFGNWRS